MFENYDDDMGSLDEPGGGVGQRAQGGLTPWKDVMQRRLQPVGLLLLG